MPIINRTTPTAERLARAAACLRQAILLIEEVAPGIVEGLASGVAAALPQSLLAPDRPATPSGNSATRPSIIDGATFSVRWANRTCHLGNTVSFRLLERLARRPNQFISYEALLDSEELWDRHTSHEAVRSAVKILRRKLNAAGMEDLADAIDGSNPHHYAFTLMERW